MKLISPQDLAAKLDRVTVLDASWHMPDTGRDPNAEFRAAHIPGALRFDIDEIADTSSALPHTLPSPEAFAAAVGGGVDACLVGLACLTAVEQPCVLLAKEPGEEAGGGRTGRG